MKKLRLTSSKKKPLTAGIALLAVLLFASCSQEETPESNNDDRPASLAITTLKATDIDVKEIATRAATTKDYPTADSIGFFVKADAANGYTACNNRKGKYSTARSRWLPVDTIWLNSHNADIAIYAPYDASHTTPATLNLTAALRPADGSKDIWCKHTTANNTSKNLAVTLEHVYTRFYLTVKRDANYKADASLTALALKGENVYESATYKPFETTPYTYSTTTGLTPTVTEQTLNASNASATYDLLLIPAELTGDLRLTLTVDGRKMETTIDKTRFTDSKLEAGKQYNVNLTLKPGKLEIASVAIVKWDALPEINGGQAEFEQYYELQMKSPVKIGKYYYATTNLRYYNNAYSFEDYPWNSARLQFNGGTVTHSYWRFGALYPGEKTYQTDQSKLWGEVTGNSNLGDPCKKMGDNWQVPSKAMLEYLVDEEQIPEEGSGIYINNKLYFFDNPYGWIKNSELAGIIRVDKKSRKALLLPAAGATGTTSIMYNVGISTEYWSNTPVPAEEANNQGYYLRKIDNGALISENYIGKTTFDRSHPLRCAYVIP